MVDERLGRLQTLEARLVGIIDAFRNLGLTDPALIIDEARQEIEQLIEQRRRMSVRHE